MADPLSIAASVAGLLTLSGVICTKLSEFVRDVKDAPQVAHSLLLAVSEMRLIVTSVSQLIEGLLRCPPRRRAMIQIDHLILTLTQTVITSSKLEEIVGRYKTLYDPNRHPILRVGVVLVESKTKKLIEDLKSNMASISFVLNILQCESDQDARNDRQHLQNSLSAVLQESQQDLPRARLSAYSSVGLQRHRSTTSRQPSEAVPATSESTVVDNPTDTESGLGAFNFRRSFESVLDRSWVYSRLRDDMSEFSLLTENAKGQSWSMLSGLSLNDIALSRLSVLALPITVQDIQNGAWYRENIWRGLKDNIFQVTVVGDGGVGKSALVTRLCYGRYSEDYDSTIEDQHSLYTSVDGLVCRIDITDSAGSNEYDDLRSEEISQSTGFLIVYSITSDRSFQQVREFYKCIEQTKRIQDYREAPIVIVGTQADAEVRREVQGNKGMYLATELGCGFEECSSKAGVNVESPFHELVRRLRGNTFSG